MVLHVDPSSQGTSVISSRGCRMSLRSLLSSLKYPRSQQECSEEAGLIISKRLKDLLASADGELETTAQQPTDKVLVTPKTRSS
jgi:hypothetical protein